MSIMIQAPEIQVLRPIITVFGVGGAGGNAINNMAPFLKGIELVAANTDSQPLETSLAPRKIQLGETLTKGLGAGAAPDIGKAAAEESIDKIYEAIAGSNMVFITAGMGGGTGTGAAPVIARIAKEQGILTVAVVTKPFHFEGGHRMKIADSGLLELRKYVDTFVVIPNQNLFRVVNETTTFANAFKMADHVLHQGVRCITDLITTPGLINLDFADIDTTMRGMGKAMMGTGEAEGENRAIDAAKAAINNPLLDQSSMKGARGVLINITGGTDMTLFDVDAAASLIKEQVDGDANVILGAALNEDLEGKIRISVIATGIDLENDQNAIFQKINALGKEPVKEVEGELVDALVNNNANEANSMNINNLQRKNGEFEQINVGNLNKNNIRVTENYADLSPQTSKHNVDFAPSRIFDKQNNLGDSQNYKNQYYQNDHNKIDQSYFNNFETEKKQTKKQSFWDIPAFLRRKKHNNNNEDNN